MSGSPTGVCTRLHRLTLPRCFFSPSRSRRRRPTVHRRNQSLGYAPVFAFRISGTGGEHRKILRLLTALYHPRNRYLLHLDAGSHRCCGNSAVAATLHAAAALPKTSPDWDWFINLSASDYPAIAQDDLPHAFTSLPRDLNFTDHRSDLGPNESGD
ncbi:Core-2/I-Branching enzyme [Musa troglodytarum]|uniref:Core-2/I-Branching enzyme n=1 Tax=Musa troglodytarum TaxID=320322 RepID=A0A9E7KP81_9LILI|nr:Core-2/I-Branching enzyme [Musa troglodytarum]